MSRLKCNPKEHAYLLQGVDSRLLEEEGKRRWATIGLVLCSKCGDMFEAELDPSWKSVIGSIGDNKNA